jgi:hypothetical protein
MKFTKNTIVNFWGVILSVLLLLMAGAYKLGESKGKSNKSHAVIKAKSEGYQLGIKDCKWGY